MSGADIQAASIVLINTENDVDFLRQAVPLSPIKASPVICRAFMVVASDSKTLPPGEPPSVKSCMARVPPAMVAPLKSTSERGAHAERYTRLR